MNIKIVRDSSVLDEEYGVQKAGLAPGSSERLDREILRLVRKNFNSPTNTT